MSKDEFKGNWGPARDPAKEWWSQLTSDSLDSIGRQRNKFVGLIQEKYGYTHEKAEQEFDRHMAEYQATRRPDSASTG